MRRALATFLICMALGFPSVLIGDNSTYSYHPPNGMVPDEQTAIRIAEAIWLPIYGKKQIESEKPFHAVLKNGIWTVEGADHLPPGDFGGVALVEIAKSDGRIIRVSHGM